MSRINTNVSSLVAQTSLDRSNSQLQTSLDRLSTGVRINSGKDDPAGLIASENLRREIMAADKAISNSERANQMIATADSALSQISGLLADIRGLVTEAANSGVLSDDQIAANQLQVDSSLDAIDRITQITTFQGRKLLDGSLEFQSTYSAGGATARDLDIRQANLGSTGSLDVNVAVTSAATRASISNTGFSPSDVTQAFGPVSLTNSSGGLTITAVASGAADGATGNSSDFVFQRSTDIAVAGNALALGASSGTIRVDALAGGLADGAVGNQTDIVFQAAAGITQASGTRALTNGAFDITAVTNTVTDGANGNSAAINLTWSGAATGATYDAGTNTINVNANNGGATTITDISSAINSLAEFSTSNVVNGTGLIAAGDANTYNGTLSGGASGTLAANYNSSTNVITVDVAAGSSVAQVAATISTLADFSSSATAGGTNRFNYTDFASLGNTPSRVEVTARRPPHTGGIR